MFGVGWDKDPAKKMQFDKMKEMGLITEPAPGVFMTTNGNKDLMREYGAKDLAFTKQVNEQNMIGVNNRITEIGTQLAEEKNPKTAEALTQEKAALEKTLAGYVQAHRRVDMAHQNALELAKAKREQEIVRTKSGTVLQRNEQGGFDEIFTPPETVKEPKTDQDRFVEDRAAAFKAKSGKDATPDQRAGWRMEYHRAPQDTGARSDRADTKEEKRKAKTLDTARREVERAYGYSQFLPTAQDPQLIEKVGKGKALVEDIIDNFKEYGLPKEPTPGKAAEISKRIIEKQYAAPPASGAAPVVPTDQAKKEMEILGLLRPKGNK
jgi:hypothetical protein